MKTINLYFKSDFQAILASDAGWAVPFRLKFYTNAPSRPFIACYDGTDYHNCHLQEDGRLCIGFDNHGLGLGELMLQPTFYLNNECYRTGICDEAINPFKPVFVDTDGEEYTLALSLRGATDLKTIGTLPAFYQKGDPGESFPDAPADGKIYGRKSGEWVEAADEKLAEDVKTLTDHVQVKDDDVTIVTNRKLTIMEKSTGAVIDMSAVRQQVSDIEEKISDMDEELAERVTGAKISDGKLILSMPEGPDVSFGLSDMDDVTWRIEKHMQRGVDYDIDDFNSKPKTYEGRVCAVAVKGFKGVGIIRSDYFFYDRTEGDVYSYTATFRAGVGGEVNYYGTVDFADLDEDIKSQFGLNTDLDNISEVGAKAVGGIVHGVVGNFDDLETEAKDNLVDAINEAATSSSAIDVTALTTSGGSVPYPVTELVKHPLYTEYGETVHILRTSHQAWLYIEYSEELYAAGKAVIKRDIYPISIEETSTSCLGSAIPVVVGDTSELEDEVAELSLKVGDLNDLLTDHKDNLVAAINDAANSNISASIVTVQLNTDVAGVSLEDINLRVYIEDAESQIVTTDASGKAQFVADGGSKIEVHFPHVTGCEDIPSITRFATKGNININATYRAQSIKYELLTMHIYKWQGAQHLNFANCPVTIIIDGTETQYDTGADGRFEKEIPLGTQYTVRIPVFEDLYVYGRTYEWTLTAEASRREIIANYHDVEVGLFMCCSDGAEYTKDEFIASGRPGSDVVMFKISNAQLALKTDVAPNGNIFGIDLNDIVNATYNINKLQWSGQGVKFTSCPMNQSTDGFDRTAKIINEGIECGIPTPASTFCFGKQFNLGGTELNGFLGAVTQHLAVVSNEAELNAMLAVVRPEASNTFTTAINTSKWTIDQSNAAVAYYYARTVGNLGMASNNAVLPFYAF